MGHVALGFDEDIDVGILDDHPMEVDSLEVVECISNFKTQGLVLTTLPRGGEQTLNRIVCSSWSLNQPCQTGVMKLVITVGGQYTLVQLDVRWIE